MEIGGWGSHIPILRYIGKNYKIERILETGIGKHSTPFFLNKEAFPDLKELISVEDDKTWIDSCLEDYKKLNWGVDHTIILAEKDKVHAEVKKMDLSNFDLVFIDDSKNMNSRMHTIQEVSKKKPQCFVVIHDFHVPRYKNAADFKYKLKIDNWFKPNLVSTGLMSNKIDIRNLKDESFFNK